MARLKPAALAVIGAVVLVVGFLAGRLTDPPAGPSTVDVGFSQDMATHHQQAILMSTLAGTRATTTVKGIASSILTSQSQELGMMRGWLRLWHRSAVNAHPMAWMTSLPKGHIASMDADAMPGMAAPDKMARLSQVSGKKFDILFLQLMIRHHQGGIQMATDARQHAALEPVRSAAAAEIVEQTEDIGTMRALLRADGAKPLPPP